MPNTFAYVALLGWPLIAVWLFATKSFEKAIIWSVVCSYLFLPSNFAIDLPGLPPLDDTSVPNLTLLAIVIVMRWKHFRILPQNRLAKALLVSMTIGAIATALTNQDPIWIGGLFLPGMSLYDALSSTFQIILSMVPLLIGWQYLTTVQAQREIITVLLMAGLAYTLLMLFEVRMSPQLHYWVYGYFPSNFLQQVRYGGFRPVVFLSHGLEVSFFAFTIVLASATLWRDAMVDRADNAVGSYRSNRRSFYPISTGYLGFVLVLCKSAASLIYGLVAVPLVLFSKPRTQLRIAVALILFSLTYPLLRTADLFPAHTVSEFFESIDPDRAQSLRVRIENEDRLLNRAWERPLFGWGDWGRNRIYDEETGEDVTVADGGWIIRIGKSGWLGYITRFGLLALPILAIWYSVRKRYFSDLTPVTTALCLLVGIVMLNLLTNALIPAWIWLISGALLGFADREIEVNSAQTRMVRRPQGVQLYTRSDSSSE